MDSHIPSTISPEGLDHAVLVWMQELSPHGICVTDSELRVQGWNLWLESASGLKREKVIGRNLLELFPDLRKRKLQGYFERALQGEISLLSAAFHHYLFPFPSMIREAPFTHMLQAARIAPLAQGDKIVGTITIVEDVTQREYQNKVEAAKRELSREILQAEENERQRVARELHDGVNQLLSSSTFRLNSVEQQIAVNDSELAGKVRKARELVNKAIDEVRSISRNLRPSELDDLGLQSALRSLVSEFSDRNSITVELNTEDFGVELPPQEELTIYRITQEALNNVQKHAAATKVVIILRSTPSHVELKVRDDGRGFDMKAVSSRKNSGWGLANMRERTALFRGSVTIRSAPAKGTEIQVKIPIV